MDSKGSFLACDTCPVHRPQCKKCDGAGWIWGFEVPGASQDTRDSDCKYTCPECNGRGTIRVPIIKT